MPSATSCFAGGFALLLAGSCVLSGADAPRAAPTRPDTELPPKSAPAPAKHTATGRERGPSARYVSVAEFAARLGLKVSRAGGPRQLVLTGPAGQIELEADSRVVLVSGLRLFLGNPVVMREGEPHLNQIDADRTLAPLARPDLVKPRLARPKVIALDPGHGGIDHGMENTKLGLKEKVLTLDVALQLRKLLVARGYKVVLTRTDDRQLGPDKVTDFLRRSLIAKTAGADLFVSIHFNSLYPDTRTSGTEIYTFTPQFQRSTRAWSVGADDDTEREAAPVNRLDPWSAILAHALHGAIITRLKTSDRGQKTMHSAVLRGLDCPGVLVESVFLSNDAEARKAATPAYRQQMAEVIADGIGAYADLLGPK